MALNKILQGMLDDFKKDYIFENVEASKEFEYFVNYLIISKYHPDAFSDKGDMDRVIVDEKSQFGLDAIAFIVNGNLVLGKDDISLLLLVQFYQLFKGIKKQNILIRSSRYIIPST